MRLPGRLALLGRDFAHIRHRQRRDDDDGGLQAVQPGGLDQHPRIARLDRQARHLAPGGRGLAVLAQGLQLLQQAPGVAQQPSLRWVDEGEVLGLAQAPVGICSTTSARLLRRISGAVSGGRAAKSSSS